MKPMHVFLTLLLSLTILETSQAVLGNTDEVSPYAAIAKRNVFDLHDPPPPPPQTNTPPPRPANFKLLGVRDTPGEGLSAVFSFQVTAPGQPPTTETHIIKEGETVGAIKVVHIEDVKSGEMEILNQGEPDTISFKTHGEKLPAVAAPAAPGVIPGARGAKPIVRPGAPTRLPLPVRASNPRARVTSVTSGRPAINTAREIRTGNNAQLSGRPSALLRSGAASVTSPTTSTTSSSQASQSAERPALSREAQIIMMEYNRNKTRDAVAAGLLPPLPPTPLTQSQNAGAQNVEGQ